LTKNHPDLIFLTDTRIKPCTTYTELVHSTPSNYTFLSFPVNSQLKYFKHQIGGGTGFLMYVKLLFIYFSFSLHDFSFFESYSVTRKLQHSKIVGLSLLFHFHKLSVHRTPMRPPTFHSFRASSINIESLISDVISDNRSSKR